VPAVRLARHQARHGAATYMYLFTWCTPAFGGRLGACHALEIPFVFNTLDAPGAALFTGGTTPEAQALADRMHDAWIAFARTGRPGHPDLPDWPPYGDPRRATMVLGPECRLEDDPDGEVLRLWDDLL
jgi:para-nitrobenzyl esterase